MSLYRELGIEPIINASGTVTRLGGAPMPAEVLQSFAEAATECVPLDQLQAAASRIIAEVTGAEAGLVTSGAAAGLTLGTASMLTGYDAGKMERLPHCEGFPHEIVIAREHRNGYDHAVRAAGARLIEVGFDERTAKAGVRRCEIWELEAAFGSNTAGVLYVYSLNSRPPLREVIACAHRHQLPVLVDAAGELPPRKHLRSIIAAGADLVVFSGGKAIRGPQATGILCGRRDLIGSAALQMLDMDDHPELWEPPADFIDRSRLTGMPRHGIGRGFKVAKEQIMALLTALRLFAADGHPEITAKYHSRLEEIATALGKVRGSIVISRSRDPDCFPLLEITVDESAPGRSALDVCRSLRQGKPPIYVGHSQLHEGKLLIHSIHLDEENTPILIRRLREELS